MRSREGLIGRFSFDSVSFQGTVRTAFNFVDLAIVPSGAGIGRHTHGIDYEETYMASGQVDDEMFAVSPGYVIVNPPGGSHALFNPGPGELRLVVVELKTTAPAEDSAE